MNQSPIIGIAGNKGSGKNTVAELLKELIPNTVIIEEADEMKRVIQKMFKYSTEQLWGPSHLREQTDPRFHMAQSVWKEKPLENYNAWQWMVDTFRLDEETAREWFRKLQDWYYGLPGDPTIRHILQSFGTEWGQARKLTLWSDLVMEQNWKLLLGGYGYEAAKGLFQAKERCDLVLNVGIRFHHEIISLRQNNAAVWRVTDPNEVSKDSHSSEATLTKMPSHWFDVEILNDKSKEIDALKYTVESAINRCLKSNTFSTTWYHEPRRQREVE